MCSSAAKSSSLCFMFVLLVSLLASTGARGEDTPATFTIKAITPSADTRRVTIEFTDEVKVDDFENALRFVPAAPIYWWDTEQKGPKTIQVNTYAAYGQSYLISINEGFTSPTGKQYARGDVQTFTMPHRSPALKFTAKRSVVERDSRQMIHLDLTNVDQVLYEGVRIPILLAPWAQDRLKADPNRELQKVEADLNLVREALVGKFGKNNPFAPFLPEPLYESHLFFSTAQDDIDTAYSVPLTFRKDKEVGTPLAVRFEDNASGSTASTPTRIYQVTDLGLSAKVAPGKIVVWATSIRTGLPAAKVAVAAFTDAEQAWYLGETDSSGLIEIKSEKPLPSLNLSRPESAKTAEKSTLRLDEVRYIAAVSDNDGAFLEVARAEALAVGDIPLSATYEAVASATNASVFTERGVYRPGERVHFKAFVRTNVDGKVETPVGHAIEFALTDTEDNEVMRQELDLSEFGTAAGQFDLPGYAPLGWYHLKVEDASRNTVLAGKTFLVQEFQPPRHQTDIRFRRQSEINDSYVNNPRPEERLICTLAGRYAVGGPVKHGRVRWKIFTAPTEFPVPEYDGYSFGNPSLISEEFIDSGESILDESGEVEVRLPISSDVMSGKQGLKFTATVIDFDGRASSTSETFRVDPLSRVGIRSAPITPEVDVPVQFECVVLDASHRPISSGDLEVSILQKTYVNTRKRSEDGNAFWTWSEVWKRQPSRATSFTDGNAVIELSFPDAGQFLVEVAYRDNEGRTTASTRLVSVNGPFGWYYEDPEESNPRAEQISIRTDRNEYSVGDTMRVSVGGRRDFGAALVAIEKNEVISYQVIEPGEREVEIPVTEECLPNVYVSVLAAIPRGEFPVYPGQFDRDAPSFGFGTTKVKVSGELNPLAIEIAPGQSTLSSRPGEEMTLEIEVADSKGRPAVAELAVAVVDEQVLRLTAFVTPNLDTLTDFTIPLSVFTFDLRKLIQNQSPFEEFRNDPLTGGGGGAGEELLDAKVRRDFSPTAYFNPAVLSDSKGKASVTFSFPDTLTAYRVYVVAIDSKDRFATAERQAVVKKDFYLEPGVPRFLRQGDAADFNVAAFNKTDVPQTFEFIVEASSSISATVPSKSFTVPAYDRYLAPVRVEAGRTGEAGIRFTGNSTSLTDAVESVVPVQSSLPIHRESRFTTVTGKGTIDYVFPEGSASVDPALFAADDLSFQLSLSGSPWVRLAPGLKYLLDYPYGCVEQTSSRLLPLSAIRQLNAAGLIPNVSTEKLEDYLTKGVERLLTMQLGSGQFSSWPGSSTPDRWGTLYALTALQFVSESGFPVDANELDRGFKALRRLALGEEEDPLKGASRGLALCLLARRGVVAWPDIFPIWEKWSDLGREERLFLVLAAIHLGDAPTDQVQTRAREVLAQPRGTDDDSPYHATMREPAAELLLAGRVADATGTRDKLAAELLDSMKPAGYWSSTADTGWVLTALVDYFAHLPETTSTHSGKVILQNGESTPFSLDGSKPHVLMLDPVSFLKNPTVSIETETDSPVFAILRVQHPLPGTPPVSESAPFTVHKTWKNTAGTDEIHVGDVIEVVIEMDFERKSNRHVVLDDPLPAGWVAINSLLATEEPAGDLGDNEDNYYRYWDADGFHRFAPNHSEFRDDRVVAVREWVYQGEYRYSYYARAICAGTFHVPPTQVQLMYEPAATAYTAGMELKVLDR